MRCFFIGQKFRVYAMCEEILSVIHIVLFYIFYIFFLSVPELKNVNNVNVGQYTTDPSSNDFNKVDSNNGTRKLQDEINILTKRNCG